MEIQRYSKLRDSSRRSLEDLLPLAFPLSMYIEPTNRCNFRCRYCPMSLPEYADTVGGFKSMSLQEFGKICEDIKAGGRLKVLRFYFVGEPLLNPHLPEMIAMAQRMNLADRTELTTNGSLLDSMKSEALIVAGLDYLRISISSVDDQRQAQLTQSKIPVGLIYENISGFRRIRDGMGLSKPFLYVKMLDSGDEKENEKFLQMYEGLADEVVIEKPMNWDGYDDKDFINATYGKPAAEPEKLYPYPKAVCPFPFYTLVISSNGDATTCCVDWNKSTCVGNVFESSLQAIWQGEAMRELRRLHIERRRAENPSCAGCTFLFTAPDNIDHMPEQKIREILGAAELMRDQEE